MGATAELIWKQDAKKPPGDLGDPLGILQWEGGTYKYTTELRNQELNHGRLAMSGFATESWVEYGTGLGPGAQLQWMGENVLLIAPLGLLLIWGLTPDQNAIRMYLPDQNAKVKALPK